MNDCSITKRREFSDNNLLILNRLLTYGYDKRGNLIQELEGDTLLHGYTYNAANRLAHAWNHKGEEAFYTYNGLGQRVGRRTSVVGEAGTEETETYLIDFTRPYHNLLGIVNGNSNKTFYWDGNVIGMEEQNHTAVLPETTLQPTAGMHYYLLDELGSPVRVNGYKEEGTPSYLTYGYDEFGNDLYEDLEEAGIPNPYSRQGEEQPFGYTGYRYDSISHSYFAQAREYQPENGRFSAEDVIKGNGAFPETLNQYGYCLNNPLMYVDANGKNPEDYQYIYYINNPNAAGGFGHTAFLLVKENGMAEYYSYSTVSGEYVGKIFDTATDDTEYEGRLFTNVENDTQTDVDINLFIQNGKVNEQWYSSEGWAVRENNGTSDEFTRAIIVPISNEQGEKIHDAAQEVLYNPGTYNLWSNNCMQVAKKIIGAGGENLVLSDDLSWMNDYPYDGGNIYISMAFGSGFIPNQDYALALMTAKYYDYETIDIGKECIYNE